MVKNKALVRRTFVFCIAVLFLFSTAAASANDNFRAAPGDSVIKVLAIGNSFSQDALEYYLDDLARAAGIKVVIGNLYIGGATLARHWENAQSDSAAYDYRKIDTSGKKTNTKHTKLKDALRDEDWDFISFQQASSFSGQYQTFQASLPQLFAYVQEHVTDPDTEYVLHQTWAYEQTSTHKGFAYYNNDQLTMYKALVQSIRKAMQLGPFDRLVPAGTAIQNGRTSFIGDHFCRDGYHLDPLVGRYTAACAWFETLFGRPVIGNTFIPEGLPLKQAEVAQQAAHQAVLHPDEVTNLNTL